MTCDVWQSRLDAYVDDSCTLDELHALEEHLRACPSCSADVLGRLQMKRAVRAAGARYAPSHEFRLRVETRIQPRRKLRWTFGLAPWLAAFAAVVLFAVLPAVLWMRHSSREHALAELVDLHVATLASPNPVDVASTDRHTVKPWFQGKLPFAFNLPELVNSEYKLLGGRLVYLEHRPAAELVYELRRHQLSVFIVQQGVGPPLSGAGPVDLRENGFNIESWNQNGLRYVIVSDASSSDVRALGDMFRAAASQ